MRAIRSLRLPATTPRVAGVLLAAVPTAALASGGGHAVAQNISGRSERTPVPKPARFVVKRSALLAQSGSTVTVHGRLLAHVRDAEVSLSARVGRGWKRIAHSRTHRGGAFHIRYRVRDVGIRHLRVSFAGSTDARAASAPAGKVVGLAPSVASWYYDAGNTACGFHATYGVANKTLPCGTKVSITYGGRTVVATVDDRGPYVYGRTFDLNQNTARYLRMWGVAQILTSV